MTRIIAGKAGGRRLSGPRGSATRPTSDRVREALFSALESQLGDLTGLRFLDLYAGTGAVGLEAWSRGAGVVAFVESDRSAVAVVRANATSIGFHKPQIHPTTALRALAMAPPAPFDLVFADPPYGTPDEELGRVLTALIEQQWLAPGALVVLERSSRDGAPPWPAALAQVGLKRYGETALFTSTFQEPEAGESG